MKDRLLKTLVLVTVLTLAGAVRAQADVYMKQRHSTQGGPTTLRNEDMTVEIWMTPQGIRTDNPNRSVIMLSNENKFYSLDHENKTYTEMPLNMGQVMDEALADADEEEQGMVRGLMGNMMKMRASVQPTSETKTIGKWMCRKYQVTLSTMMGPINQEVWATEDIPIDEALKERLSSATNAMMPGMQESMAQITEEMKKVKGVQVLNTSTQQVMNKTFTTTTELVEYRQAQAPTGIFRIPDGYRKANPSSERSRKGLMPQQEKNEGRMPSSLPAGWKLKELLE